MMKVALIIELGYIYSTIYKVPEFMKLLNNGVREKMIRTIKRMEHSGMSMSVPSLLSADYPYEILQSFKYPHPRPSGEQKVLYILYDRSSDATFVMGRKGIKVLSKMQYICDKFELIMP